MTPISRLRDFGGNRSRAGAINYTGDRAAPGTRSQHITNNTQAFSAYNPPGKAQPAYDVQQQTGGFPAVPQQGQRSAPDMSAYASTSSEARPRNLVNMGVVEPSLPRDPSSGGFNPSSPTWDDPRNARARERYQQQLDQYNKWRGRDVADYAREELGMRDDTGGRSPGNAPARQSGDIGYVGGTPGFDERTASGQTQMAPSGAGRQPSTVFPAMPAVPPAVPTNLPFSASYGMIGGGFSPEPQYAVRDAFINNINNALQQGMSFGTPEPAGPPQLDFNSLYGQAQQMVADGWSNPLAGLFR